MTEPKVRKLDDIYGEHEKSGIRYRSLAENFSKIFHSDQMEFFTAPGRTEIVGNHTDHNGGKILAGSISLDTIGAAYPNDSQIIRIVSEGYKNPIIVDLTALSRVPKKKGSFSLVAGIAQGAGSMGFTVSGFNAYVSTEVIPAAGVSSSASFEMLICAMINVFFNNGKMRCVDFARIGQYAENTFWDKASGLMDQMACAAGGTILLDFSKDDDHLFTPVDFSFSDFGCDLVIVNTGKGHADLSEEYSSIPLEMKEAAQALGADRLCETDEETLLNNIGEIHNDRAVLRALHYFEENKRVEAACKAIGQRDKDAFFAALAASGHSSWEWLQNGYAISDYKEQKVTLTLALTQLFLDRNGGGICRIHGGGFAGVIATVLPVDETEAYKRYIAQFVGEENVYPMNIRSFGAGHVD